MTTRYRLTPRGEATAGTAILLAGAVGWWALAGMSAADAHTPTQGLVCGSAFAHGTNYNGANTLLITLDGTVVADRTFATSYDWTASLDLTVPHSLQVVVHAHDGGGKYDVNFSKEIAACQTATPTPTVTSPSVSPTSTPTSTTTTGGSPTKQTSVTTTASTETTPTTATSRPSTAASKLPAVGHQASTPKRVLNRPASVSSTKILANTGSDTTAEIALGLAALSAGALALGLAGVGRKRGH